MDVSTVSADTITKRYLDAAESNAASLEASHTALVAEKEDLLKRLAQVDSELFEYKHLRRLVANEIIELTKAKHNVS